MKVRIVKCSRSTFWYADQIDSTFQVLECDKDDFSLKGASDYLIKKEDCEILEADEPKPEPFDLERAMKGERMMDERGGSYTYIGNSIKGIVVERSVNGNHDYLTHIDVFGHTSCHSLKMAPREPEYQTVWVNLYAARGSNGFVVDTSYGYATKEQAMQFERPECNIGTFPITFKKP